MPPEQVDYLVIIDVWYGASGFRGKAEYVQSAATLLRVRWGAGQPPKGYAEMGNGVVFVSGAVAYDPKPPDENWHVNMNGNEFQCCEGFDGAERMLVVMTLPEGYEFETVDPPPNASRSHRNRLAVYWRIEGGCGQNAAEISGAFRPTDSLREALTRTRMITNKRSRQYPLDPEDQTPDIDLFLSYRRDDDKWAARKIREALMPEFTVFRDQESIDPGDRYPAEIDKAIGQCKVLLALIGARWLDPDSHLGERRVDSSEDWPRVEIESALQRHKRVVPVLLDGIPMPEGRRLPESLQELSLCQSFDLREDRFDDDFQRLVKILRKALGSNGNRAGEPRYQNRG